MKAYKWILTVLLFMEISWILMIGNATIQDLTYTLLAVFLTGFFRYYYKESYEYFTRYT